MRFGLISSPTLFRVLSCDFVDSLLVNQNQTIHEIIRKNTNSESWCRAARRKMRSTFPIRRTRWLSFFIGAATLILTALIAAGLSGLLMLAVNTIGGVMLIILFGFFWGCLFFLSYPWQRRFARALDCRRPGISLDGDRLTVPIDAGITMHFNLSEPLELSYGWFDTQVATIAAPTMHTQNVLTYAVLSQAGQQLFLKAEDSVREAIAAGWSKSDNVTEITPGLRLWERDLVALVEFLRTDS
jgi:hypothetical protein